MTKEDLLQTLDTEFASLLSTLEGLGEEAATRVWYGDWSVRDILSHVSGWHREMAQAFERIARGERPVPEDVRAVHRVGCLSAVRGWRRRRDLPLGHRGQVRRSLPRRRLDPVQRPNP